MRTTPFPSAIPIASASLAVLLFACPALSHRLAAGQEAKPAPARARATEPSRTTDAIHRQMDLEFKETALKDVAAVLSDRTGVTFHLRARARHDAGVNLDAPVTGSFRNMKLGTILDLVLSDLDLTYVDAEEAVLITTNDDAESRLVTRVYDCRDLLAAPPAAGPAAPAGPPAAAAAPPQAHS